MKNYYPVSSNTKHRSVIIIRNVLKFQKKLSCTHATWKKHQINVKQKKSYPVLLASVEYKNKKLRLCWPSLSKETLTTLFTLAVNPKWKAS